MLVGRDVGGDKKDLLQIAFLLGGLRQGQVAAMDGIEGPAEQSDIHGCLMGETDVSFVVSLVCCKFLFPEGQESHFAQEGVFL